ncbi:hypothetical protein CLI92_05975 [Vandammella animalimorsus]|uniref:Uncharacterized protein n=1 Tax=Vandammella animalimorsus TaxID=2029117 RepID=A0A2A2T6G2_9BURK|nr:hypothetical protein [Vandammella animalimorsus]PAX17092.1 hypothetical protein CLI92_05975 [Vandammella animalimorsus]PAX19065.1 hypothetical protein CLI93_09905 [Vandammella animalimorsus]RRD68672.1 hypothetical protein EII19_00640 [Comamonadaceae bacterium OH2310_COT-174]
MATKPNKAADQDTAARYVVREPLRWGGQRHEISGELHLTPDQAKALLERGLIAPASTERTDQE